MGKKSSDGSGKIQPTIVISGPEFFIFELDGLRFCFPYMWGTHELDGTNYGEYLVFRNYAKWTRPCP